MNFDEDLNHSVKLLTKIEEKMSGLVIHGTFRGRAASALLQLSLEHFGAIVILLRTQLNGSAASLLRLQYEALIRGMYFDQCASESEAERFFEGKQPPRVEDMITKLEERPGFTSGVLGRVHGREWKTMNSYTHGGNEQVLRRFTGSELTNNYSEKDVTTLLKATKFMALMAAAHAAIRWGSIPLAKELEDLFEW